MQQYRKTRNYESTYASVKKRINISLHFMFFRMLYYYYCCRYYRSITGFTQNISRPKYLTVHTDQHGYPLITLPCPARHVPCSMSFSNFVRSRAFAVDPKFFLLMTFVGTSSSFPFFHECSLLEFSLLLCLN